MISAGTWVRAGITLILLLLAIAWLAVIFGVLGQPAVKGNDGEVVDQYQRAKDILLVVLPLLTTALGYWFGSAGKQQAEDAASQAHQLADKAQRKLAGVLDSTQEEGLLDKAREKDPEAFQVPSRAEYR